MQVSWHIFPKERKKNARGVFGGTGIVEFGNILIENQRIVNRFKFR